MIQDPHEPTWDVPVTEEVPPHDGTLPASQSSDSSREHEFTLPASTITLPTRRTRPWFPWLIGMVTVLTLVGAATWFWWTSGAPPVQYKTAVVARGPITAIVTATGTINPVVSVQVSSQARDDRTGGVGSDSENRGRFYGERENGIRTAPGPQSLD